jgi:sugar fermentation stimulation protein A
MLAFPDAVTVRGQKHARELTEAVQNGSQSFLLFVVMRASRVDAHSIAKHFRTAHEIDPAYAMRVSEAITAGVKVRVVVASITLQGLAVRGYFEYSPYSCFSHTM